MRIKYAHTTHLDRLGHIDSKLQCMSVHKQYPLQPIILKRRAFIKSSLIHQAIQFFNFFVFATNRLRFIISKVAMHLTCLIFYFKRFDICK